MNKCLLMKKLTAYQRLMRLDKPVGILLLLWPTLWGLLLAGKGRPDWQIVFIFVTGVILMRSAGCVMNDIADRHYDGHVERTKNRPLVIGEVTVKEALLLAMGLSLTAFSLVCFLNKLTILLSIPALLLAATYPLTKRFLAIPQAYLGFAFGFSILMTFAALTNHVPTLAWWLLLANVFWAIAYDTEYAMVDREDDVKIGIQSSAILFGRYDLLAIMLCYVAMLAIFIYVGKLMAFSYYYFLPILVVVGLVIWQYQLIKTRNKTHCFKAFLSNNWIGLVLFIAVFAAYYV
ncbi:MAG: 4-hydroxybenzoate octaprenyltransferase [Methylophilaceae bacterium]|nr:MAG: 4-hydroxybenzoate octaprenyltransferase [Methylophilaceae bacterium]